MRTTQRLRQRLVTVPIELAKVQVFQGRPVRRVRMAQTPEGRGIFGTGPDGEPLRAWAIIDARDGSIRMRWMYWPLVSKLPKTQIAETYEPLAPSRFRVQATWDTA